MQDSWNTWTGDADELGFVVSDLDFDDSRIKEAAPFPNFILQLRWHIREGVEVHERSPWAVAGDGLE